MNSKIYSRVWGCYPAKQEHRVVKKLCIVKKLLTGTVLFMCCFNIANAEEISLKTSDIDTLISGKTINGVHYGKKTIQYFSKSGLTLWIGQGDELPTEGQWKVENNQYCSNFGSDWGCLDIVFDAVTLGRATELLSLAQSTVYVLK